MGVNFVDITELLILAFWWLCVLLPVLLVLVLLGLLWKYRPQEWAWRKAKVPLLSGLLLFYAYLPPTYSLLATVSQSLSFNSEIELLRDFCLNWLVVVWVVAFLPLISRLMLFKGLGYEHYRSHFDIWGYVWGVLLAMAYFAVWWLGYVSAWVWDFWWLALLQQQGFQHLWGLQHTQYGVNSILFHLFENSIPILVYLFGLLLCLFRSARCKMRRRSHKTDAIHRLTH